MSSWFRAAWFYIICWWLVCPGGWAVCWLSILARHHSMITFYLIIFRTSYYYWIFPWFLEIWLICQTLISLWFYRLLFLYFLLFIHVIWTVDFAYRSLHRPIYIFADACWFSSQMREFRIFSPPFLLFKEVGHIILAFFFIINSLFSFLNFYFLTYKKFLLKFNFCKISFVICGSFTFLPTLQKFIVSVLNSFKHISVSIRLQSIQNIHEFKTQIYIFVKVWLDTQHSFSKLHPYMWDFVLAAGYVVFHKMLFEELTWDVSDWVLAKVYESFAKYPIIGLYQFFLHHLQQLFSTWTMMLVLQYYW